LFLYFIIVFGLFPLFADLITRATAPAEDSF